MVHGTSKKIQSDSTLAEKKYIFLFLATVLLWCMRLGKNVIGALPRLKKTFLFLSEVLHEHGTWDLEKLNLNLTPVGKTDIFVSGYSATIVHGIYNFNWYRPSPKKRYFYFWFCY